MLAEESASHRHDANGKTVLAALPPASVSITISILVVQILSRWLSSAELAFESEDALEHALLLCRKASAGYPDCVHAALAATAREQPLWTFDKAASKVDDVSLLT
ncbi:MAG: hypothetical protein KJZ98_02940 [Burkholderiaceae bacterium]|jgi:predicted nucleic acid-binding protein|nr:hypothetical protein [Burkholderiaceae bacterium]MEB2351497.1 hypothetical protein [Burkholderiaceae bacterium]